MISSPEPVYKSYKDTPSYRPLIKFEPTVKGPDDIVIDINTPYVCPRGTGIGYKG